MAIHEHPVSDSDIVLIIDASSRAITNHSDPIKKIMQGDHNCERITFQLPRFIDGHDMTECNLVRVHFINIGDGNEQIRGVEYINDLDVSNYDPDIVEFSWLISGKATSLVGALHFCIQLSCLTDGYITYSWSTAICKHLSVSPSMDNTIFNDGEYDKTINDVPYSPEEKEKLAGLPTRPELDNMIALGGGGEGGESSIPYLDLGFFEEEDARLDENDIPKPRYLFKELPGDGVYVIAWDSNGDGYQYAFVYIKYYKGSEEIYLDYYGTLYMNIYGDNDDVWEKTSIPTYELDNLKQQVSDIKKELTDKADKLSLTELQDQLGEIETALDSIIEIQNSLIGGDS